MSRKHISMRKIKEVHRLNPSKALSPPAIAGIVKIGRTTVQEYLSRAKDAGITLEIAESITEDDLENRLFKSPGASAGRPLPDWKSI